MTSDVPYAEVIGDPVDHSKSPLIHGFWLKKLGLEGQYRATRVTADQLPTYLTSRRADPAWRGCNVTMPLKLEVASLVDRHRSPERPGDPVNLVVRDGDGLLGTNTDVHGILEPVRALLQARERQAASPWFQERSSTSGEPLSAVVLGSGGVLQSATRALRSLGYYPLTVVARSEAKVRRLLGSDHERFATLPWGRPIPSCDLLVNATPLGMEGHGMMPYDASPVRERGAVFEMIYAPLETSLLADARRRQLRVIDGLQMLVAQAAPSFEQLFGAPPPRKYDAELRELLTA